MKFRKIRKKDVSTREIDLTGNRLKLPNPTSRSEGHQKKDLLGRVTQGTGLQRGHTRNRTPEARREDPSKSGAQQEDPKSEPARKKEDTPSERNEDGREVQSERTAQAEQSGRHHST